MKESKQPAAGSQQIEPEAEIGSRARDLIVEMFEIDPASLRKGASLADDLDLDSIDVIDLLMRLNDEYGLEMGPYEFENCRTLEEFLVRIRELKASA